MLQFEKLSAFLDSFLEMGIPGYDCIIYRDGEEVYRRFQGYSDYERKIPMNGRERYNTYSCSKPVTCTAALQLYEKGRFHLEDCLSDYMPEFRDICVRQEDGTVKPAGHPVRIKDLFCMTTGYTYDISPECMQKVYREVGDNCSTRDAMRYLAKEPLLFEPGERWAYGLSHDILAALVEVISGEKFGEYVRKNIFQPLGMSQSTFSLPEKELDTLAEQYRYDSESGKLINCGKKQQGLPPWKAYESGGGSLVSTVEDYIRFLEALRIGNVILKKETVDLMSTNQLSAMQLRKFWSKKYGYGLGVRCPKDDSDVTDFGWEGAAGAWLAVDRVHNMTIFYIQHVLDSKPHGLKNRIGDFCLEAVKDEKR